MIKLFSFPHVLTAHSRHSSSCRPHVHGLRWYLRSLCQSGAPAWQEEEVWHQSAQENTESCVQRDICIQGKSYCDEKDLLLLLPFVSLKCNKKRKWKVIPHLWIMINKYLYELICKNNHTPSVCVCLIVCKCWAHCVSVCLQHILLFAFLDNKTHREYWCTSSLVRSSICLQICWNEM